MKISMYSASVPVLLQMLKNLDGLIEKTQQHAAARKIDPEVFVTARLYADMFPLSRQIQIATDMAKGGVARLAGMEPPKFEDNETTLTDLRARISKTIAFIESFNAAQLDGSEERTITLSVGGRTLSFEGLAYLLHFVLPNFYFHITTAYAIFRHWGVEVGKSDFLGAV